MFGIAGPDDRFGSSLTIGDATGDGGPYLVVGTPRRPGGMGARRGFRASAQYLLIGRSF